MSVPRTYTQEIERTFATGGVSLISGFNLIITHEPTFYDHYDKTDALAAEGDPVYAAKAALIKKQGLVIWRFHDYWHRQWKLFHKTSPPQRLNRRRDLLRRRRW